MKRLLLALSLTLSSAALAPVPVLAGATDSDEERTARWNEIKKTIFNDRTVEANDSAVKIDAPARALDASLVPVGLTLADKDNVKGLYFIIDDNPSPYAAHFTFGPAADPAEIKLRVRVNNYTNVHAVVETKDGKLIESAKFVKASGGCSAPMGMSDEEAMKGMGDMRMKFSGDGQGGKPVEATLMVRHPNFSGMQMNQVTRDYTPARYIEKLDVMHGDQLVFQLAGDISIASNPVINFGIKPDGKGPVKVMASDNQGGRWEHSFALPSASN
ncbi:sulfur-oxidizing protein SoxY [Methylorubrum rhodinum]|jgi:sulfur-oxidizing protein SoxY|uniref:Sulfur-oxidizing protein SoxY n=1 Tax=Methylorubrum rhodinum TaxID=29428 RepID=A0A840ZKL0_9HYPH|nr:quinoprotein dehydrogenase-associated SoxYZ-like carrier [Methylorubrum rhodinum]MBB5758106.1 sulfur-oxidizing protein SoxY [Methylorubrum rhodinum]